MCARPQWSAPVAVIGFKFTLSASGTNLKIQRGQHRDEGSLCKRSPGIRIGDGDTGMNDEAIVKHSVIVWNCCCTELEAKRPSFRAQCKSSAKLGGVFFFFWHFDRWAQGGSAPLWG